MNVIAIDDEPIALEVLKNLSEKVTFMEVSAYFTNAFEAMAHLQQNKVDLIFLDIKMPDISGIEFLKTIPNPPLVIFTTAYSEHAVESFELDAIDYLLKPFSFTRFLKACNKAYEQYNLRGNPVAPAQNSIFIKSGYEQIRVEVKSILYAESKGNYVQFVLEGQKIMSRLTMSEVEGLLPSQDFVRIHRSFLAAKAQIQRFDKKSIWVYQTELPIGAAYVSEIEKNIKQQ
jgi:DNA-binding LytR/AlgR family response regulator